MSAHDRLFGVVQRPWLAENFVGNSHFADVVKKSGASQRSEIRERNGNVLGNGNGVGSDPLGMASSFRVFKVKSAAECSDGVVVSLSEMLESVSQFSGFLFQLSTMMHLSKHHYMDLGPLGR